MFLRSTKLALISLHYIVERYYDGINVTATEISLVYNMNPRALMVALRRLTQVGILKSQVGGVQPGFRLSKDPKEISMYDIIISLEGLTAMNACKDDTGGVRCQFDDCSKCKIYNVVNIGINNMYDQMKSLSLYDHYFINKDSKIEL